MLTNNLCPPALIYLIFSITQISIDAISGYYNKALVKFWVSFVFTILLNHLCNMGLGTISWIIVFIPFILMTLVVSVILLMFGLDPNTGNISLNPKKEEKKNNYPINITPSTSYNENNNDDVLFKENKECKLRIDNWGNIFYQAGLRHIASIFINQGQDCLNKKSKEDCKECTDELIKNTVKLVAEGKDGEVNKRKILEQLRLKELTSEAKYIA